MNSGIKSNQALDYSSVFTGLDSYIDEAYTRTNKEYPQIKGCSVNAFRLKPDPKKLLQARSKA